MPGLLDADRLGSVVSSWRRVLRTDPLLSRVAMPELQPFAEAFNRSLTGEDDGELTAACDALVKQELTPETVIRITTILAEIFTDEVGTESGAVTKSLVGTLGYVCGLLVSTMVGLIAAAARRDPLTALENVLAWNEALADALQRNSQVALAIIDLDGLKQINDGNGGHAAGDRYLRRFASSLHGSIPETARAYRFGGDEFSVIFTGTSADEAAAQLEMLRAPDGAAPFSFGIASAPAEATDADLLKGLADDRMYVEKRRRKAARAARDPLTGLETRVAFEMAKEAGELGESYALVAIDLDGLKKVNDAGGHTAGDDYLRRFGELLDSAVSEGVRSFRLAGDEFAVVFPETPVNDAIALLEALRRDPNEIPFSLGAASAPDEVTGEASLLEVAFERAALEKASRGEAARTESIPAPSLEVPSSHDDLSEKEQ
jgi:diguanylate cyclase (GGDEF)-like protein